MKRAFVTGVTGYIGGSVAKRLRQDGYAVKGLVRTPAAGEANTLLAKYLVQLATHPLRTKQITIGA